jgi:hypothetical protein
MKANEKSTQVVRVLKNPWQLAVKAGRGESRRK